MKNEITIEVTKVEDSGAASKRRVKYAQSRDLQAMEFNNAIVTRQQSEARNLAKCEKCGKEFSAAINSSDSLICPKCK